MIIDYPSKKGIIFDLVDAGTDGVTFEEAKDQLLELNLLPFADVLLQGLFLTVRHAVVDPGQMVPHVRVNAGLGSTAQAVAHQSHQQAVLDGAGAGVALTAVLALLACALVKLPSNP